MENHINRIRSRFRNTAKLTFSNPLAFNGHHVLFKVRPVKSKRLGTLGEQLKYWKGQKRSMERHLFNAFLKRFRSPFYRWGKVGPA